MRIDLDSQKLVLAEKNPQNKTPQKLTPFSQIKNSAFNGLVPLGRYRLDLKHNAVVCYANKTMYKEQKMSSEQQFSSSDWCEWVI